MASQSGPSTSTPRRKTGRGLVLKSQSRLLVYRLYEYFLKEKDNHGSLISTAKVTQRVSDALQISRATVSKIVNDHKKRKPDVTPGKQRPHPRTVTSMDSFTENAIKNHIYSYYERKEWPSRKKLLISLKEADLFHGAKTSLSEVLHKLNFKWKKIDKRKFLLERSDIVAARCIFLRQIRACDFNNVIFLDETWVNAGHCVSKAWADESLKSSRKLPSGRGGRLIVTHAGSATGFVPNALYIFRSKKTGDYHEDMNSVVFQSWFFKLMENIPPNSTIVMDNAPYHSVVKERPPTTAWKKSDIQDWLTKNNVEWSPSMLKPELMELVRVHKPRKITYEIDHLAHENGHRVIRLPPYHCQFNPIELIWAQIKGKVAKENKSFNLTEVEQLTKAACESITTENWREAVRHTREIIESAWEKEGILEENIEQMIIEVRESSSSASYVDSDSSGSEWGLEDTMDTGDLGCSPLEEEKQ